MISDDKKEMPEGDFVKKKPKKKKLTESLAVSLFED